MDRELREALTAIEVRIEGGRVDMAGGLKRVEDKVGEQNKRLRAVESFRSFATGVGAAVVIAVGSMAAWIGLVVR